MAIINKIEVIPQEVLKSYEDEFSDSTVVFMPDINNVSIIKNAVQMKMSSYSILRYILDYLRFPYLEIVEGELAHYEGQAIERVLNILTELENHKNNLVRSLLNMELELYLSNIRGSDISIHPLTKEEVDNRIVYQDYEVEYNREGEIEMEDGLMGTRYYIIQLKTTSSNYYHSPSIKSIISNSPYKYEHDKFCLVYKLGIIEAIQKNWEWSKDGEDMFDNNTQFAEILSDLFGFTNPNTIRTYLVRLRTCFFASEEYLTSKQKETVTKKLNEFGITAK